MSHEKTHLYPTSTGYLDYPFKKSADDDLHVTLFLLFPITDMVISTFFPAFLQRMSQVASTGLTWWINNGVVEGHVTKLKLIKRQGYGQAGFPLLRKRVLHAF